LDWLLEENAFKRSGNADQITPKGISEEVDSLIWKYGYRI
jgi:hypothetical protein